MPVKTKISMAIVFLVSSVLAPGQSPVTSPKTPNKDAISIQTVLNQVRDALIRCQKKLKGKQYPPLQSVDLTFQTVAEKDAGGTVKLWIISAGAKRESEQTQEVTIHLTPPSADNPTKVGAASLTEELENTIVSAIEGAQNAGTKEYPLLFSSLTVELSFTVKNSGNAGVEVQLMPVSLGITGQVAKNATQKIKVVFQERTKV